MQREWREFGQGCAAAAISAVLLLADLAYVGDRADVDELTAWLDRLGLVLLVWLVGWPLWETLRNAASPAGRKSPSS